MVGKPSSNPAPDVVKRVLRIVASARLSDTLANPLFDLGELASNFISTKYNPSCISSPSIALGLLTSKFKRPIGCYEQLVELRGIYDHVPLT